MKKLVLKNEVLVTGHDFWGRKTSVLLRPTKESGWYWQTDKDIVPVTPEVLSFKKRRLVLAHGRDELNVFEHLGPLRFFGLDHLLIVPESRWLPYDGSSDIFWSKCKRELVEDGELGSCCYSEHINVDGEKILQYIPTAMSLRLKVSIDYPGLGYEELLSNMDFDSPNEIAAAKTQGWPMSGRRLAILAEKFVGWPHRDAAIWPQEHELKDVRRMFAEHRRLDLLGALSTLCTPGNLLSGTIVSHKAGHKEDVGFIKNLRIEKEERVVDKAA